MDEVSSLWKSFGGWGWVMDLFYISAFLLISVALRRFIPFFRKFRIPDAIVAGLLGIIAGPSVLGIIPWDFNRLTSLVYHLLAIGFIALGLRKEEGTGRTRTAISSGFYIVVSYAIQGIIGLGITLILIKTLYPNLFPAFGFLLPFGFGQGGLAGTMGRLWETKIFVPGTTNSAFPNGASIGFSFYALGLLWACFVGVPLMNWLIRRRKRLGEPEPGFESPPAPFYMEKEREFAGLSRSIDKATTQVMLVGIVYLVLFFGLQGFTWLLYKLLVLLSPEKGVDTARSIASIFWGFQFGFGALIATFVGQIIRKLEAKKFFGFLEGAATSNYILQHIGGAAVDLMTVASIAAIDLKVFVANIFPIMLVTTVGGFAVIGYTWYFVRKVWPKTYVEHFLVFYGTQTGTLATAMTLLRGVDPQFRTSAASDMIFGSGIALIIGMPLIIIASFPIIGYTQGQSMFYSLITLGAIAVYGAILLAVWLNPASFRFFTKHTRA